MRINHRIRAQEIRLIDSDGSQKGVYIVPQALKLAEEQGLDLVEISPNSSPPVCRIMDYGKYKYEQSKKKHESKKHQSVVHTKEIKMRAVTEEHDFQTKLRHAKRFLEEGDKVRFFIRFRGREMAHVNLGYDRLKKVVEDLNGLCEVEQTPKMESHIMSLIIAPSKKK